MQLTTWQHKNTCLQEVFALGGGERGCQALLGAVEDAGLGEVARSPGEIGGQKGLTSVPSYPHYGIETISINIFLIT